MHSKRGWDLRLPEECRKQTEIQSIGLRGKTGAPSIIGQGMNDWEFTDVIYIF